MIDLFTTYLIDSGKNGPHLLITAGIHGDEYEPMLAAGRLVKKLGPVLQSGKVTIAPLVNSSAFRLGRRCGEDGLDLARTCPGKPDGSITQQVASQVSGLIPAADYYIDMHTGGLIYEIFPLSGYMLHSSDAVLEQQQKMAQAFGLPVIWGTDRYAEGRTLSVARDAHVPAIYVEYGGGTTIAGHIVDAYFDGCLGVLNSLDMISDRDKKEDNLQYWVEDYRLNNGHLQSKTPAPEAGLFIPKVQLGQLIQKQDQWGIINDPATGNEFAVLAEDAGMVLFTRVAGYVNKGDALGGILPVSDQGKIIINEA